MLSNVVHLTSLCQQVNFFRLGIKEKRQPSRVVFFQLKVKPMFYAQTTVYNNPGMPRRDTIAMR
jgi:hypothetical protein